MENLTGRQFGPYRVVEPLGEGGMAAVYKGFQPSVDRYVALKVLPRQLASDPQFVRRFEHEAKGIAKLQHPHILPVIDYGTSEEGYTYIVMPFYQAGTLATLLQGEPLPLPQIRRLIAQIGDALDYAHGRGIIHRDVKPSNVLLDERGNCLLTDFGVARFVEDTSRMTATGAVIGTPTYMSPEQGMGRTIDHRTDIYSLGIILYEMATGRAPFHAETPIAVLMKHIYDPLPPPRTLNPELSEPVERVILKALAKQPEDRYAAAGDMVRALQEAVPERTVQTAAPLETLAPSSEALGETAVAEAAPQPEPAAPSRAARKPARASWMLPLAGIGIMGLLAAAGVTLFFFLTMRDGPPPTAAPTVRPTQAEVAGAPTRPAAARFECTDPIGCVAIPPGEAVHIAYILALSGDVEPYGRDSLRAIELALDDRGWEVLGHPVELSGQDAACRSDQGERAARQVAANPGVIAVIGTTCSSSARTALPVLSAAGLVMISPSNTVVSLTDPAADWLPGYFRTSPHDLVQARVAAEFAYHQTAARSASTVHDDERYGEQLVQLFVEAFSRLGGEILVQGSVGAGGNRAGAAAAELANAPPDLVFAPIFEGPALRFLAEVSNQPGLRDTTLLGPDSLLVQSFAQSAGRRANGMYLTGPQPSGPSYEQLLERWLAKYGEHPTSPWHAHAYDAANLLLNAIQRVAVQDPDGTLHIGRSALRDELAATTNYRGITGTLHCTPQGDCAAGESIGVFHLTPAETGRGRWPPSAVWTPRRPAYPGVETVPLSSLSSSVPWLALDAGRVPTLYQISFNVSRPPFDIPLVRQAFASAVNREAIVGLALELGYREPRPATTFVHPQSLGRDLYGQVGWSFDPARARDLLAQAGYPNGRGFPPVQLLSDRGDGRHEAIMNAVARMWRETLGVEVQVVFVDSFRPYLARLEADPPPVFRLGWTLSNDPGETLSLYSADSDSNFGGFSDPSFNRLLEQGLAVRAPAERQALYVAAERILCEQAAASLPLFHYLTP